MCLTSVTGALTQCVSFRTKRKWSPGKQLRHLPLFGLGLIRSTPGGFNDLLDAGQGPEEFIRRHVAGDWGDLDEHDLRMNERALREGHRVFSVYRTKKGEQIHVITEWDRSATTILLPSEY